MVGWLGATRVRDLVCNPMQAFAFACRFPPFVTLARKWALLLARLPPPSSLLASTHGSLEYRLRGAINLHKECSRRPRRRLPPANLENLRADDNSGFPSNELGVTGVRGMVVGRLERGRARKL